MPALMNTNFPIRSIQHQAPTLCLSISFVVVDIYLLIHIYMSLVFFFFFIYLLIFPCIVALFPGTFFNIQSHLPAHTIRKSDF